MPASARRRLAAVFLPGLLDMAGPTKRLQPVNVIRVWSGLALQRRDVIALEASGPTALDLHLYPSRSKTARRTACHRRAFKIGVMPAHVLLCDIEFFERLPGLGGFGCPSRS